LGLLLDWLYFGDEYQNAEPFRRKLEAAGRASLDQPDSKSRKYIEPGGTWWEIVEIDNVFERGRDK